MMDSLPHFRTGLKVAATDDIVTCVVGDSAAVARRWHAKLASSSSTAATVGPPAGATARSWAPHVSPGGFLAFHDVFPDPNDGGRPPFECFCDAVASGRFTEVPGAGEGSLRVLVANPVS